MKLRDLRLLNYRNHKELYIKFNDGLNIICGRNSVGKTNILEAIHLCLKGKSFKNSKDEEMIGVAIISGHYDRSVNTSGYKQRKDKYQSEKYLRNHRRSEERRVGKECRSRWSPYH